MAWMQTRNGYNPRFQQPSGNGEAADFRNGVWKKMREFQRELFPELRSALTGLGQRRILSHKLTVIGDEVL
jgi:hypothetical protein